MLVTIEQQFRSDRHPFRLARVGATIFADAGRVWSQNPPGGDPVARLSDAGPGLHLAPTRCSARKMFYIDKVQILVESSRSTWRAGPIL
jgi:hypothetical protein